MSPKIYFYLVFLLLTCANILFAQTIIVKPYLQDGGPDKMTVMWEVDGVGNGFVDYGSSPFTLNLTANSTIIVGNVNTRIHAAAINGLSPSSKYYYRVRMASGTVSRVYNFTTQPSKNSNEKTNFIAMSDIQRDGGNPNVYKNLVENGIIPVVDTALTNGVSDLEGILIPGDLVQTGGNYGTWKSDFFDLADSLTTYVPMYPVPGNHEYYGDGLPNFLKYFTLPLNGSPSNPEEWWYKDFSNVRVIGLNSNSPAAQLSTQLSWLQTVLDEAGADPDIDFVFAQLHHPYKSELWVPGELDFTGDIITKMELFSTTYHKPSLHFFGHTHAYSRGQSRDHNHLWVNVATAGGAIDNWGEFPNADYDEFVISEDEYGFVLMQVEAGPDPSFRLRRFSRGDQNITENNTLSDEINIKRYDFAPQKPVGIYPAVDSIIVSCVKLNASTFYDPENTHQASHWQLVEDGNFQSNQVIEYWTQSQNWYNEVNTQAGDDLTDLEVTSLTANKTYHWRVRYRDQFLNWSEWSEPLIFHTKQNSNSPNNNLLLNAGAEAGLNNWTGEIESLLDNECNSVPVYSGSRFFAIGGVCANEQIVGFGTQTIDITTYANDIDQGLYEVLYSAYMRAFATNNDKPEMYIEFLNTGQNIISTSPIISNLNGTWTQKSNSTLIPSGTRYLRVVLKGTRLTGTDNDSYFDELSVKLVQMTCPSCVGSNDIAAIDNDGDGYCSDIDCNDNDASIYPGGLEICDGKDNDCDGRIETGDTVYWTGNGDGSSWEDVGNWGQGFLPLPCQHVVINTLHKVLLTNRAYIKSIQVGSLSILEIAPNAELYINGFNTNTQSAAKISGLCNNLGKCIIKNSSEDGLSIDGTLNNNGGQIYIKQVELNGIRILPSGKLVNISEIEIKE